MKIFKTITVSLIISICFSFLAFGEGMSQITGQRILRYGSILMIIENAK